MDFGDIGSKALKIFGRVFSTFFARGYSSVDTSLPSESPIHFLPQTAEAQPLPSIGKELWKLTRNLFVLSVVLKHIFKTRKTFFAELRPTQTP